MKLIDRLKIKIRECLRCGHEWLIKNKEPIICPNCKSPYWNIRKKRKKK